MIAPEIESRIVIAHLVTDFVAPSHAILSPLWSIVDPAHAVIHAVDAIVDSVGPIFRAWPLSHVWTRR